MAEQITLFNERSKPRRHTSSATVLPGAWSYSRRDLLERCPRWYYYQYYGANAKTAKADPQKETLRFLKLFSNRYLRTGEIAHLVIRTYLNRLRQGEEWSLERVLRWARTICDGDLKYSRNYKHGTKPINSPNSPALLMEFYMGFENAEELWKDSETRLLASLTNFVMSPEFAHFRNGVTREGVLVEKPVYLKEEYFSMRGRIDLAYPDEDDRIVVVDWKIGNTGGGDDSLQLLSYALGAINEYKCAPENIDLYRVPLMDNKVSPFPVSKRDILRASARIIQDVERFKALDSYGCNAIAEAFTSCEQLQVCNLCPFQECCLRK